MEWRETAFTRLTGSRLPIVAAPMAGGPSTPELVAAVSEAGGLGILGCAYQSPDAMRDAIREVRHRTAAPFGVNLLLPEPVTLDERAVAAALEALRPYADELGVVLEVPRLTAPDRAGQVDVVLTERVPVFSFSFGTPPSEVLAAMHDAGIVTCGTATSVAEAVAVAAAGTDMVCAQGSEAGGHRGWFLGDPPGGLVGLMALVPAIRTAVDIPVLAAGGLMDGDAIAAALTLGAAAAQLGTAFLLCPEAGTSAPYRRAIEGAAATDTVVTTVFSGRHARGLRNRMTEELAGLDLPAYPVMNALTRELRRRAGEAGRPEFLSLWAGQGVSAARALPAADLLVEWACDIDAAFARFRA